MIQLFLLEKHGTDVSFPDNKTIGILLQELKGKVAEVCVEMHQAVVKVTSQFWEEMRRRYYVTPSSYMELIRIYSRMLQEQKNEFMGNRNRLLIGLSKLSEAESLVGTMQEELVNIGPKIEEKARVR